MKSEPVYKPGMEPGSKYSLIDVSNIIYQVYFRNYKWYNPAVHKPETLLPFLQQKIEELIAPAIAPDYKPILLFDKKQSGEYWRQNFIEDNQEYYEKLWADPSTGSGMNRVGKEQEQQYKGARLKPTDYNAVLNFTRQAAELLKQKYLFFEEPGLEADDWAGLLIKYAPENAYLDLITVDKDWSGLLTTAHNRFRIVDMYPKRRYEVQYAEDAVKYFQKKLHKDITEPRQAYQYKAKLGEPGDNLLPGSHIELIDLINYCAPIDYGFRPCHDLVKNFYQDELGNLPD